VQSSTNIQAEV